MSDDIQRAKRIMRKLIFLFMLVAALMGAVSVVAAQGGSITINTVDDSEFPVLRLFGTVQDANGEFVTGLTEPDFSALVAGQNAEIVQVEEIVTGNIGASVVMVIDSSESLFGPAIEDTKAAAIRLIDQLRPTDEVAIVEFDSTVRVAQPFTSDLDAAQAAVNGISADGRTSLYDAAYTGVETAVQGASNEQRFVVLITDGQQFPPDQFNNDANAAVALAQANNIPIFAVGFGTVYPPYLESLGSAVEGGGTYILPNSETIGQILNFISGLITSQYVITIQPDLEPDGSPAPIELSSGGLSGTFDYTAPDLYPTPRIDGVPTDPIAEPVRVATGGRAVRLLQEVNVTIDDSPVQTFTTDNFGASIITFEGSVLIDPLTLAPGEHTITVEAVDQQGASRSTSQTFMVAELPLVFDTTGIELGEILDAETPVPVEAVIAQSQTAVESVVFAVDGEQIAVDAEAPYTAEVPVPELAAGAHILSVTVENMAGQIATQDIPFTIPLPPTAVPPTATLTAVPPTAIPTVVPPTAVAVMPTAEPTAVPPTTAPTVVPATSTPVPTTIPLTFTVTGIALGETVEDEARAIRATPDEGVQAETAVFTLDGEVIDTDEFAPFIATVDMTSLMPGAHLLDVTMTDAAGESASQQIPFTIPDRPTATPRPPLVISTPVVATAAPTEVVPTPVGILPTDVPTDAPAEPFSFTLTGLEPGAEVSGGVLSVALELPEDVTGQKATFSLDGEEAVVDEEAPFGADIDVSGLQAGEHVLNVVVEATDGRTGSADVPFIIPAAAQAAPTETPTLDPTVEATALPAVPVGFTLSGLSNAETISEAVRAVEAVPNDGVTAASVEFSVDGTPVATDDSAPFTFDLQTAGLNPGIHTLSAVMTDTTGATAEQALTFNIPQPLRDFFFIGASALLLLLLAAARLVITQRSEPKA
jgi:Ca-activated chloride channel family protein